MSGIETKLPGSGTEDRASATRAALDAALAARAWTEAVAFADHLIARTPDDGDLHHQRGLALWKQELGAEALQAFSTARALPGDHATLLSDYSLLLATEGAPTGAVEICRAAVTAHPSRHDLLNNLGIALIADGQPAEALQCFNAALELAPQSATSTYNRGFAKLLQGDLKGFFQDNEARFAGSGLWQSGTAKLDELPLWMGEPIAGLNLLVHAEQGFGDTLQFIRFIPLLAALKPARLTVHVQPELLPALQCLRHFAEFHPVGSVIGPCHFSIPLLSVPHRLGIDWPTLPAWTPYLAPDAARLAHWRARLADAASVRTSASPTASVSRPEPKPAPLRIGLVWQGSPGHTRGRERSVALHTLHRLALPGIQWVSLQAGAAAAEALADTVLRPLPLGEELVDFADTAALISQLDLVISIDTAVAHLAAALGHPTWVLDAGVGPLWLTKRVDSPWYPTVRLFRQPARGDWQGLVESLLPALQERLEQHRRASDDAARAACAEAQGLLDDDQLSSARDTFRKICATWPGATEGWLGAALAAEDLGDIQQALECALKARLQAPAAIEPHVQLARLQQKLKRPLEALCSYQHALARSPDHPVALAGLARLLRLQNCPADALPLARHWVRLEGDNPCSLAELALVCLAANDPLAALRWAQASLAFGPQQPELQALTARCLALLGGAVSALVPAIARYQTSPADQDTQFALAEALFDAGLPLPAIGFYQRALQGRIDHATLRSLSDALIAQSDWPATAALGQISTAHFPDDADLRCDHATALWKQGQLAVAEPLFDQVLTQQPNHLAALLHGSAVALARGQIAQARQRGERALALAPDRVEPLLACAAVAETEGDDAMADRLLLQVLSRDPSHAQARFSRGTLALKAGDWARGWTDYEARADAEGVRAYLGAGAGQVPRWHGEPLEGRHLVVCAEQGLGDTLQILRCLPLLAAFRPARVTLQVQVELAGWLRSLPNPLMGGIFEVVPRGLPLPPYQTFVPLLSLPGVLGLQPDSVPPPWLPPINERRRQHWAGWLDKSTDRQRIGLCWAGNPAYPRDLERSPGLDAVLQLLQAPQARDCDWISLLYGERGAAGAAYGMRVPTLSPALGFGDTAALLANLDLVITCDTALAHLSASLGLPTWLMLAKASDWRWGPLDGHSPWYPNAALFRQSSAGDWNPVVQAMIGALPARPT